MWKYEDQDAAPTRQAGGQREPCRRPQRSRPFDSVAGLLLSRPSQRRGLSERDPGSGGSARPEALAPPRRAATRGSRREPQARAGHLLFGAARNDDRVGAPAHRVLMSRSLSLP